MLGLGRSAPEDVIESVTGTPRSIPCKYFYDEAGAALFDQICALPEYYPTRTETGILRNHVDEISRWAGAGARVVEFGSGSGEKTRLLLEHLHQPSEYVPIDICHPQLLRNAESLRLAFPALEVSPLHADYTRPVRLRPNLDAQRTIVFFPGSTIGNFEPREAVAFLRRAAQLASGGGGLLIGVDLKKDPDVLDRAYNDAMGITAEFNLNIMTHINALCGADFDASRFEHLAFYNAQASRIEMHLRSTAPQTVTLSAVPGGPVVIELQDGELIKTEHSYKYDADEFRLLASAAGFVSRRTWIDARRWFSVHAFDIAD
jgi:L-histidine N-alpha-methyltransferase